MTEGQNPAGREETRAVRVIRPEDRDRGTAQTSGMERETAIDGKMVGARNLWVGFVRMGPGAQSGAHHHGPSETGIYVVRGSARVRFGSRLEHSVEAKAGDFLFVPPQTVHQEINLSSTEPVDVVVVRDSQENIVVPAGSGTDVAGSSSPPGDRGGK